MGCFGRRSNLSADLVIIQYLRIARCNPLPADARATDDVVASKGHVIEAAEMRKASGDMNSFTLAGTNPVADAEDTSLSVASRCHICGDIGADSSGPEGQCTKCASYRLECAVCRTHVKSRAVFCIRCGHGGHSTCIQQWSAVSAVCPTGCGCRCGDVS